MDGAVLGGEGSSENCKGRENGTYVSIPMHRCTSAACQLTNGMTVMPPKCRPAQALSRTRENSLKRRENGTYVSIPMHRCTSAACQLTNGMTVMPPKCRPAQALSRTRENSHKGF